MLLLFLVSSAESAPTCTTNALRTTYSDSTFKTLTVATLSNAYSGFGTLDSASATKVTTFTQIASPTGYWCNDILPSSTQVCCALADLNTISLQFAAKLTYGAIFLQGLAIAGAMKNTSGLSTCTVKSGANITAIASSLTTAANTSITKMLYGVYLMLSAAQPFSQTLACLACANDDDIATYYNTGSSTLSVSSTGFNAMLDNMAYGVYKFNDGLKSYFGVAIDALKSSYFETSGVSGTVCSAALTAIGAAAGFCSSNSTCRTLLATAYANTMLEFEALATAVATAVGLSSATVSAVFGRRELGARMLTTSAVTSGGIGMSTNTAIVSGVKIAGMDAATLQKNFGLYLSALLVVLTGLLF